MKCSITSRPKRLLILAAGIIFVLLLGLLPVGVGPGGMGDWTYDRLPNGYEIWRLNSRDIQLVKDGGSTRILDRYILEFCYNDSYIGIKHISSDEMLSQGQAGIANMDTSNPEYYLIDTQIDAVFGPYTADDYQNQIAILQIQDLCGWIPTVPTPDGARA